MHEHIELLRLIRMKVQHYHAETVLMMRFCSYEADSVDGDFLPRMLDVPHASILLWHWIHGIVSWWHGERRAKSEVSYSIIDIGIECRIECLAVIKLDFR